MRDWRAPIPAKTGEEGLLFVVFLGKRLPVFQKGPEIGGCLGVAGAIPVLKKTKNRNTAKESSS
jgi:hypothetical protein